MLLRSKRAGQPAAPAAAGPAESVDRAIARFNIEHFCRLLSEEKDVAKQRIIRRLLAEEEARLDVLDRLAPPQDKAG